MQQDNSIGGGMPGGGPTGPVAPATDSTGVQVPGGTGGTGIAPDPMQQPIVPAEAPMPEPQTPPAPMGGGMPPMGETNPTTGGQGGAV